VGNGSYHVVNLTGSPTQIRSTDGTGDIIDALNVDTVEVHHTVRLNNDGGGDSLVGLKTSVSGDVVLGIKSLTAGTNTNLDVTATNITINTSGGGAADAFQTDTTDVRMSNASTLTTFVTMTGTSKMKSGEEWKINMCVLVCVPDSIFSNSEQLWEIETSAGVFTEFDRYSTYNPIIIEAGEMSIPYHRTKKLVASMDAPRMRLKVRRVDAGSSPFAWEHPRWGGVQIEEAP
jgi:hypothetical protein